MKKKLLFVLPTFEIGGTTVSTKNLLSLLDKNKYDITVWCLDGRGLLKKLYDDIPQIQTSFVIHSIVISSWKFEKGWFRKFAAIILRWSRNIPKFHKWMIRYSIRRSFNGRHFDTVVACEEGLASMLALFVPADNRVAWVRCDYNRYFQDHHQIKEGFYQHYKNIVCVAEQTTKNFIGIYPEWKDKTICINNPQNSDFIRSQATVDDHDVRFRTDKTVIVSLGRLCGVKRFSQIPVIARQIKEKGLRFVWYIIGDGPEMQNIANAISLNNVDDCVVMLGAKSNPHFYISHADLYVCLSISEACPRVINEAKILGTPVVSTDFPTIYEYIEDGVNGRITFLENMPLAIIEMLTDAALYARIKKAISFFVFDNSLLVKKLEEIL